MPNLHTALLLALTFAAGTACASPDSESAQLRKDDVGASKVSTPQSYVTPGPDIRATAAPLTLGRAGDTGTVDVRISGAGARQASLSSSTGLEVLGPTLRDVSDGETMRVDVRAPSDMPAAGGRHYLDVIVTDEAGRPRAMSVAVQVGTDTRVVGSKPANITMTPDGTPMRTVRARETIDGVAVEPLDRTTDEVDAPR